MINIINNFKQLEPIINFAINDTRCSETNKKALINLMYVRAKEIAVNLNDEIQKTNIPDDRMYTGMVSMISNEVDDVVKSGIKMVNLLKKMKTHANMTGLELKTKLNTIPNAILTVTNYIPTWENTSNIDKLIPNTFSYIGALASASLELLGLASSTSSLNESVEDVSDYVNELNKVIEEIREYYEKSDYVKLLTPRKKQIDKIEEYMRGALERKYKLRVPLYKIEDVNKSTRDIVENKLIKDMQEIVAKYKNYVLLTPNWDEDEDIYIYLTLKEPFGKEGDIEKRMDDSKEDMINKINNKNVDTNSNKKETINESATLTKKDREMLDDKYFGLPKLRKYPLNDEIRIKQAVKMFHLCKPQHKKELATNIAARIKELGLEDKITIKKNFKFKKFFPEWMYEI